MPFEQPQNRQCLHDIAERTRFKNQDFQRQNLQ
jgi:hypothetical protein